MKLRPAHEKALKATLRMTLFSAALGVSACSGGGGSSGGGAVTPADATGGTGQPAVAPADAQAQRPTSDADCRAALKEAYPDGDPLWPDPSQVTPRKPTAVSDADLTACCDGIAAAQDTRAYRELGCCSLKEEPVHCTPWGPPMPPAMAARGRARALA